MRTPWISALALAVTVAGCGGQSERRDSPADARRVVTEFAAAVNARDGTTLCERLTTQDYIERTTAARGDAAIRQCKAQIASLQPGGRYRVVRFVSTRIAGNRATVVADLDTGGKQRRTTLRLVEQKGGFRLTSGTGG